MAELIDLDICSSPQGEVVKVTSNPRANLMFYIHCISNVLDLSEHPANIKKLRDYRNFHLLTDDEIDDLLIISVQFYPAVLIDKCIILNDDKCGKYENRYVALADAHMDYPVVESMTIGGEEYQVMRAMYFTVSFAEEYYYIPMSHFNSRLDILKSSAQRYSDNGTCCTIL
ncbi:hypothetical protein KP79_PYT04365 [Mizuhopecten yessoensis]|uniref:Uncharacterized protein n=1 Tax=Mizuhopecten yessoensis TaxID=6573 RepID=A0A210R0W1_MIZYE|nr:hypothetical protein KP79_PYT04365 [Mizuhopecten yessoensis]